MKTVESIAKSLNGKKIILRLDLNVPLNKQKITDTNRIDKIIPTLHFLIKNKAKVLILSHVGRPKGKIVKELSMEPICEYLKNRLGQNIHLIKTNINNFKDKDLFHEAIEKYNQAIFINPSFIDAYKNKCEVLEKLNKLSELEKWLKNMI